MTFGVYLAVIVGLVLLVCIWMVLRKAYRKSIYRRPFKAEWLSILSNNVPLYSLLPEELKPKLHGHINFFLHDKIFVGRGGQVIDDDIRLTVAGNACLLVLNQEKRIFPGFKTIIIYPDTYVAKTVCREGLTEVHHQSTRAGESWHRGPIVLSWGDVLNGSKDVTSGFNVVLHEFAHKLDEEDTVMDGLPILHEAAHYAQWAAVLSKEYEAFLTRVQQGDNKVIDAYGAESPIEFFAVVTESFFEKSLIMHEKLPDLYFQFKQFYQLDPAEWHRRSNT